MAAVLTPDRAWARLASDEQIRRTAAALQANGMHAIVVDTGDETRHQVFDLLPAGAQVMTMTSRTLETIGVTDEIDEPSEMAESPRYDAVRPRLMLMDSQTQAPEMRRMGVSSDRLLIPALTASAPRGDDWSRWGKHRCRLTSTEAATDLGVASFHVLKDKDLERFRKRLAAERVAVEARIAGRSRDVQATVRDEEGVGDRADEATLLYDREQAIDDADLDRDTLAQIDRALERIEAGTYGVSEVSGRPIPIDRLEAVPYATTLVDEEPFQAER